MTTPDGAVGGWKERESFPGDEEHHIDSTDGRGTDG